MCGVRLGPDVASWSLPGVLAMAANGQLRYAKAMAGEDDATVDGWDIPSLLELSGGREIDLLKVDVEGSELEIFDNNSSRWLPKVRNICIELHGPDCEEAFLRALGDFDYDLGLFGELTVCWNLRRKSSSSS